MKRRRKKGFARNKSFAAVAGIVLVLIVSLALGLLFCRDRVGREIRKHRIITSPEKVSQAPSAAKKRVAIIIDDIGYDLWPVEEIIKLQAPVTLSILPLCPYSKEAAEKAYHAGKEVMLHLPMEPDNYPEKNPGDGALFISMSKKELIRQLEENLQSVPHASGVNNHMGSRFMEDERKVKIIFKELKERNLFFIDSYTTKHTKGKIVAGEIGLHFAGRDIFTDNNSDYHDTLAILNKAIEREEYWNTLIIIGHPYDSTIEALKRAIPLFKAKGIQIVPSSQLAR